jgi:hypothetical protein
MNTSRPVIRLVAAEAILGGKSHQPAQNTVVESVIEKDFEWRAKLLAIHKKLDVATPDCTSVRKIDRDALPETGHMRE